MIIPKQDKVKRLLLLQLNAQVPVEEQKWIQATLSKQTEEPGFGSDSYCAASAVSPNANHQDKTSSLFTIDCVTKPLPNAAQTLEDPHVED